MKTIYLIYHLAGKYYLSLWFDDKQSAGSYALACGLGLEQYRIDTFTRETK